MTFHCLRGGGPARPDVLRLAWTPALALVFGLLLLVPRTAFAQSQFYSWTGNETVSFTIAPGRTVQRTFQSISITDFPTSPSFPPSVSVSQYNYCFGSIDCNPNGGPETVGIGFWTKTATGWKGLWPYVFNFPAESVELVFGPDFVDVTIGRPSDAIQSGYSKRIRVWKPSAALRVEAFDARPLTRKPAMGPAIVGDFMYAAGCCPLVNGAVADGVTHLLLRMPSTEPVTFQMFDPTAGSLKALPAYLDGPSSQSVQVTPAFEAAAGAQYVNALYKVPADLGDSLVASRTVTIRVSTPSNPVGRDMTIQLHRPPVLLLHGFWSDKTAWRKFVNDLTSYPAFAPSAGFRIAQPNLPLSKDPLYAPSVFTPVSTSLNSLRDDYMARGIVVGRVDVVTKSTGGPVATLWASKAGYEAQPNFYAGDFHRVITIAAIHRGSFLADLVVGIRDNFPGVFAKLVSQMPASRPINGTVLSLTTDSVTICSVPQLAGNFHAIYGNPNPPEIQLRAFPLYSFLLNAAIGVAWSVPGANDGVTSVTSAKGGLPSRAVSDFPYYHAVELAPAGAESIENKVLVGHKVRELLNSAPIDFLLGPFASFPAANCGQLDSRSARQPVPAEHRSVPAGRSAGDTSPFLVELSGLPPSVAPGTQVTAVATATTGDALTSVLFMAGEQAQFVQTAPFQATFTLDTGGSVEVTAVATTASGEIGSHTKTILVQPTGQVTALAFDVPKVTFSSAAETYGLVLTATYSGGEQIQLTDTSFGVTLSSSAPGVATISPGLVVTASAIGTSVITASLGGINATVTVTVDSVASGDTVQPTIVLQPANQTVIAGQPAVFIAVVTGTPAPWYQWQVSTNGGTSWANLTDTNGITGSSTMALTVGITSAGLHGARYRVFAMNSTGSVLTTSAVLSIAGASVELVSNTDFGNGLANWVPYATPDLSYIVAHTSGDVLNFYRNAAPPGTSNQAVVLQQTGISLAGNLPIRASFNIGNTDSVRKRISILLHDADFGDLAVCTFWLPPNAPLQPYQMDVHTTKPWLNATISFYAASENAPGNTTGYYQVDQVSLKYLPSGAPVYQTCSGPGAPTPPGGVDGPNLLTNGDFASGAIAPGWTTFGQIQGAVTGGVFEFIKLAGSPAGVILQETGQPLTQSEIVTASLQLGNSSTVRKRVTVILHDHDFSDLSACTFWLAPGQPLATFVHRTHATKAWANATLSVYPATIGDEQWIQLDNVSLQRTPAAPTTATLCVEPGGTAPDISSATSTATSLTSRPASADGQSTQGLGRVTPASTAPGANPGSSMIALDDEWLRTGFEMTRPEGDGSGPGWVAIASRWRTSALMRRDPIDLTDATVARLIFRSQLSATTSQALVQASADGTTWETLGFVPASDSWISVDIDLSTYRGRSVTVRLLFQSTAPDDAAISDTWRVRDVEIDIRKGRSESRGTIDVAGDDRFSAPRRRARPLMAIAHHLTTTSAPCARRKSRGTSRVDG